MAMPTLLASSSTVTLESPLQLPTQFETTRVPVGVWVGVPPVGDGVAVGLADGVADGLVDPVAVGVGEGDAVPGLPVVVGVGVDVTGGVSVGVQVTSPHANGGTVGTTRSGSRTAFGDGVVAGSGKSRR